MYPEILSHALMMRLKTRYELTCTLSERNVDSAAITTIKAVNKNFKLCKLGMLGF